MQGKTHKAVGLAFMTIGFEVMRQNNMLIPDVNPYLQLAVMYPISQWGSTAPDLDSHWESTPNKSPINWVVHKLLHLTKPKHRSWQTHSILVTGSILALLYALVLVGDQYWMSPTATDWIIMRLLTIGLILGVASHLVADFFNPSGIHLIPGLKIRGVPKKSFFATGGTWETRIVYKTSIVISIIVALNIGFSLFGVDLLSLTTDIISTSIGEG